MKGRARDVRWAQTVVGSRAGLALAAACATPDWEDDGISPAAFVTLRELDAVAQPVTLDAGVLVSVTAGGGDVVRLGASAGTIEVIISPWRDPGTSELEGAALVRYKYTTQFYSYAVSLTMGVCAGLVGVRAIAPLMDAAARSALSSGQRCAFDVFDVIITALLLAGGSDGIHQVVTTITTFLAVTRKKMAS